MDEKGTIQGVLWRDGVKWSVVKAVADADN